MTLTVPSELTALSNMPVENEKLDGELKTVYFEESPLMSTYLVAAVVGLFDHIEDTSSSGMQMSHVRVNALVFQILLCCVDYSL